MKWFYEIIRTLADKNGTTATARVLNVSRSTLKAHLSKSPPTPQLPFAIRVIEYAGGDINRALPGFVPDNFDREGAQKKIALLQQVRIRSQQTIDEIQRAIRENEADLCEIENEEESFKVEGSSIFHDDYSRMRSLVRMYNRELEKVAPKKAKELHKKVDEIDRKILFDRLSREYQGY
jgi:hypothetical protein